MRDVLPTLQQWEKDGRRFATATVTHTWGSSPRPIGAVMGIREDGVVCGSVSGGCVESAVIEESLAALKDGQPKELVFGAMDESKYWEIGLSCGGKIQVWVTPEPYNTPLWSQVVRQIDTDKPVVTITRYQDNTQTFWDPATPAPSEAIHNIYKSRRSAELEIEGQRHFVHVLPSRERLIIVGSVHIAVPLVRFAKELGFETVVIDPRAQFSTDERFPTQPDKMITEWPQTALSGFDLTEETYAVVLTHDPKIDDPALAIFLKSPVAYIGALGSRTTQAKRREDLAALGYSEQEIQRIHGPIGLAIGARSPEEIALSIMAEIVQVRNAHR